MDKNHRLINHSLDKVEPDNQQDFQELFSDIKPIEQDIVAPDKEQRSATHAQIEARLNSVLEKRNDPNYLATDHIEWLDPYTPLEFKKDGIQEGVFKKLRTGKYSIEARLDLFKTTSEQARDKVYQFLQDAIGAELRCLIINHGLGLKSTPKGRLKSFVNTWLGQTEEVVAFHSAQKHHGGLSATYVLLRKSTRKRIRNRERYNAPY
jgi:DNA-nicking Smr family endonuclease